MRAARRLALALGLLVGAAPAQDQPAEKPLPAGAIQLHATGMPADAPLKITAHATPTQLTVHLKIDPDWHIYGRDGGRGQPLQIECTEESAFAGDGGMQVPMNRRGLILGEQDAVLPLRPTGDGDKLVAEVRFMVCDALQCLPPMVVTLTGTFGAAPAAGAPLHVLLVATADDERTARIAAFLKNRGTMPTVATWNLVTKEQCDAADVVLADSPLFDQVRGVKVSRFPDTDAPIVAVGYLGTELLKAKKVAMASGYI